MKKFYLISSIVLFLSPFLIYAQNEPGRHVFETGEKLHYKAYYNWRFIWLYAGNVTFNVSILENDTTNFYKFSAIGNTRKAYDLFFKVRDHFESKALVSSLKPLSYSRNTFEGGYFVDNKYKFDYHSNKIYTQTENSHKPPARDTIDLKSDTRDVLTAIYYCRNIDFSGKAVNDTISLNLIIDNQVYDLYIRYHGRDKITLKTNVKHSCFKFTVLLVEGTIFRGGEDLTVWVTDDEKRIPVLIDSKVLVGSVKAILSSIER